MCHDQGSFQFKPAHRATQIFRFATFYTLGMKLQSVCTCLETWEQETCQRPQSQH